MNPFLLKYCRNFLFLFFGIIAPINGLKAEQVFKIEQEQQLDSLNKIINNPTSHDTLLVEAYLELSEILYLQNLDTVIPLSYNVLEIVKKALPKVTQKSVERSLLNAKAGALNNIGAIYSRKENYDSCTIYFEQSLSLYEEMGNRKAAGRVLNEIGNIHQSLGDLKGAMKYFIRSLEIAEREKDQLQIARALHFIGLNFKKQGNISAALENYFKSLKIRKSLNLLDDVATSLNNIAVIYFEQGDVETALQYFHESLEVRKEVGDKIGIAGSLNNLGYILGTQKKFSQALEYHQRSLNMIKEIGGNQSGVSESLQKMGIIHKAQKNFRLALQYFYESLEIRKKIGVKKNIVVTLHLIGITLLEKGELTKALDFTHKALKIAQEIGNPSLVKNIARTLSRIYEKQKNGIKALEMYKLYISMRDSVKNISTHKAVIHQKYKHKYERKAAADSVRSLEYKRVKEAQLNVERAKNAQQRQRTNFLYIGLFLAILFGGFIFNRFRVIAKQKKIIEEQKFRVDGTLIQLESKNKEILDSITYAKRIQLAILPSKKMIDEHLPDNFILYKPKDIVAGDFYWMQPFSNGVLFAVADCTGHGVPGAMVSVICNNGLNRSVKEFGLIKPGEVLDKTREIVCEEFEKSDKEVQDGMDIALCSLTKNELHYAGAHNPLWIIRNGISEVEEIKANKQPIGKFNDPLPYDTHKLSLNPGDAVYLFSDGYYDQFGGEKGKKLKTANFKKLLLSISQKPMNLQYQLIDDYFEKWKGDLEQLDDVCVIGIKV